MKFQKCIAFLSEIHNTLWILIPALLRFICEFHRISTFGGIRINSIILTLTNEYASIFLYLAISKNTSFAVRRNLNLQPKLKELLTILGLTANSI